MADFFVDRFVRVGSLDELVTKMKNKSAKGGGGSIRGIRQTEIKGGNAVNLGYALGLLGANVNLIAIADSLPAEMLRSTFAGIPNVNLQLVKGTSGYTIAFEYKDKGREVNVMVSDAGDLSSFDGSSFTQENKDSISKSKIVAVTNWSANTKGNELCERVFSFAKQNGARTFFDPADPSDSVQMLPGLKSRVFDKGLIDYVSLNENEARVISKVLLNHDLPQGYSFDDLTKTATILSDSTGTIVDIHTRPISLSAKGKDVIARKCHLVESKTVTGAGDVWAAADLSGYLTMLTTEDRLSFANSAGGLYVSRESAATPSLTEILEFMRNDSNH